MSSKYIGIDIRSLLDTHTTGVGQYTYGLLDALFRLDTDNRYVLFYSSVKEVLGKRFWQNQEHVQTVAYRFPNKILNFSASFLGLPCLDRIVQRKINTDIDIWFNPNIAKITALSENVKKIYTVHDLSFEIFPQYFHLKDRLLHRMAKIKKQCANADVILVPSESTKDDVLRFSGVDESKIYIQYPGISSVVMPTQEAILSVKDKFKLSDKFIFFLGTIEPRKNIISVIEAFSMLCGESGMIPYELIIAGAPGWKNTHIHRILEGAKNIRCIGYVSEEEKRVLYHLASLFVYPSLYEGFGFPVVEAMAAGTPVITSNRSSLPEVSAGAAYMVNPYNVAELKNAMKLLLIDTQLKEYYRKKGKLNAERFTWENAAKQLVQVFELIGSKDRG